MVIVEEVYSSGRVRLSEKWCKRIRFHESGTEASFDKVRIAMSYINVLGGVNVGDTVPGQITQVERAGAEWYSGNRKKIHPETKVELLVGDKNIYLKYEYDIDFSYKDKLVFHDGQDYDAHYEKRT